MPRAHVHASPLLAHFALCVGVLRGVRGPCGKKLLQRAPSMPVWVPQSKSREAHTTPVVAERAGIVMRGEGTLSVEPLRKRLGLPLREPLRLADGVFLPAPFASGPSVTSKSAH
jgi:hypothetical protein